MSDLLDRLRRALADRYAIEREVGRGGMAHVFLAQDLRHRRRVAVKVLRPELAISISADRFLREIEIAAGLTHPHILPLYDSGEAAGLLYYVMPFVDGESLRERLQREVQLPVDDALRILDEVADALAYAHSMGVVHRDVKPANILLHEGHAVVSDFGVASATSFAGDASLTDSGFAVGTPAYMSPEQAGGGRHVDGRSDVYSLAAVFYEMLAGEPPYTGATPQVILAKKLSTTVHSLTPIRSVTPALDGVLRRALATSAADRYPTARQFADAVRHALHDTAMPRPRAALARHRAVTAAAAVLLAAGATGLWWALAPRAETPETLAVLPFQNVGDGEQTRAFVDGLMEVLATKMTQLEQFFERPAWVIPASEIRDQGVTSVSDARRAFGVTLAITGSVQRAGDMLRVTLNLVDAATLRQRRSVLVQGSIHDLAPWQDGIVGRVAEMLDLELRPQVRRVLSAGGTRDPEAYDFYVQGRGYLQNASRRAELETAAQHLGAALARDPGFALAHAGLGETSWRLYQETRDTSWVTAARVHSRQALALDTMLLQAWVTLGLVGVGTGRHGEAVAALQRALALDPYSSEAHRLLASAYAAMGEVGRAEETYRKAIALKPYEWSAYNSLGVFYYQQGRYEEAAVQFLKVAELNPLSVRGYANAGGIYFLLDRWDEARRLFEQTLTIQPTARAYSNLGSLDFYEGHYARAARRFDQATELAPADHIMWGNAADAYRWVPGEAARADSLYRRALELARAEHHVNPTDPALLSRLLRYHAVLGARDSVMSWRRTLEPLVGNDPDIMFRLAWSLELVGERDAALEWLRRAVAAGFSRRVIDRTPELRGLRNDPRFHGLTRATP